jgi:hypothetical protein
MVCGRQLLGLLLDKERYAIDDRIVVAEARVDQPDGALLVCPLLQRLPIFWAAHEVEQIKYTSEAVRKGGE